MSQGWQAPGSTPDDEPQRAPQQPAAPAPPHEQAPPQPPSGWGAAPPGGPDLTKPPGYPAPPPQATGRRSRTAYGQQYGYGYGPGMPPPAPLAPRPGVIPLRPLSLGEIYDGAFQVMRRNPGPMIGSAAIVGAFIAVVGAVFQLLAGPSLVPFLDPATADQVTDEDALGAAGAFLGGGLVTVLVTFAGIALLNGVLVLPVSRAVTGLTTTFGEVWKATWPRFWALIGLVLLAFVIAIGIYLAAILVPILLAIIHPAFFALLILTIPVMVLGLLWVMVRSSIALPALMLERTGPMTSWQRVRALVGGLWTGPFWRTLGILLLAAVIVGIAQGLLTVPAALVSGAIGAANPDDPLALAGFTPPQVLISAIASIIASAVIYPFQAGVGTLLYVDHRMRREGLDVELARAASQ